MIKKLSVISTVDPGSHIMENFYRDVFHVSRGLGCDVELIVVNDIGGPDHASLIPVIRAPENLTLKIIDMESRRGQLAAILSGMKASSGDAVLTIDPDMTRNLADIGRFLECLSSGKNVIYGRRVGRNGMGVFRFFLSRAFAWLASFVCRPRIRDINTPMTMLSRHAVDMTLDAALRAVPIKYFIPFFFRETFSEIDIARTGVAGKKSNYGALLIGRISFVQLRDMVRFIIDFRLKNNGK